MNRILFRAAALLLVAACILTGCAGKQSSTPSGTGTEPSSPHSEPVRNETTKVPAGETETEAASSADPAEINALKASLDPIAGQYGAVGVQAAIIRNGEVYACYEYGYADKGAGREVTKSTKYRCASLSKLAVAMTAAVLADEGILGWDDDVGDLLGCPVRSPSYPDVAVTPRMLLTHTSSVIDSGAFLDSRNSGSSAQLSSLLSSGGVYSGAKPGSVFSYSNFGVALLAAAIEKKTGVPFQALAKEKLFGPLGMDAAFLASDLKDKSSLAPLYSGGSVSYGIDRQLAEKACETLGQTHHLYQGNLTVSAADYAKLIVTLLNDGVYGGRRVLSHESVAEITGAQFDTGLVSEGVQGFGECQLRNLIGGRTMHCHTGSNFGMYACFAFDPADKSGVVILTSGANAAMNYDSGVYNIHTDMIRAIYKTTLG